ncbi:MAG: LemA family protein [Rhodobiaceae bacterium]|nr:LemA family protein [Rhodobiaceae bacterium]MCC0018813.1 LemA family protein [Rhodobiaceae bacterium]MCC0059890.1 LemA family protein [Rhodobiaceae bacterium]
MTGIILLAIIAAVVLYAIILYNQLVSKRQMANEGWSGIDVQLKRRTDLIPNLLESVKGYMSHEKDTLREVTELRTKAQGIPDDNVAERAKVEGMLSGALGRLLAIAENYPDLKASQNFIDFQDALEDTENKLEMARRYYNGTVRDLNVMVEQFPSNLIAGKFGFTHREFFEIEEASERAVPKVSFDN